MPVRRSWPVSTSANSIMRADARRILIVAPGSLVEQWRDELFEKFGLEFRIYSSVLEQASPSGNPFEDHHQLIVRLDQMSAKSKDDECQEQKALQCRMGLGRLRRSPQTCGPLLRFEARKNGRFRFAERLGERTLATCC